MRTGAVLLLLVLSLGGWAACSPRPESQERGEIPVFEDELEARLTDPRLLARLGVEAVVVLEAERYRVTLGSAEGGEEVGALYYTIQDGWHLKADNEVMELIPGEGWLIAEQ